MKLQKRNTVRFVSGGNIMREGRIKRGETWRDTCLRCGINVGTPNSADGLVRIATWNGCSGEVRIS